MCVFGCFFKLHNCIPQLCIVDIGKYMNLHTSSTGEADHIRMRMLSHISPADSVAGSSMSHLQQQRLQLLHYSCRQQTPATHSDKHSWMMILLLALCCVEKYRTRNHSARTSSHSPRLLSDSCRFGISSQSKSMSTPPA